MPRFSHSKTQSHSYSLPALIKAQLTKITDIDFEDGLSALEAKDTNELCLFYAWQEQWNTVTHYASQAIASGCNTNLTYDFYRHWIEALKAESDTAGLSSLSLHLMRLRHNSRHFLALACLAMIYAGKNTHAQTVCKNIQAQTGKSLFEVEVIGTFLCEHAKSLKRSQGLTLLSRVCESKSAHYYTRRNFFVYSLENDAYPSAATACNALHAHFPHCPEPLWSATHIAICNKDWAESSRILKMILNNNPENAEALLLLSKCLEKSGELMEALTVLVENSSTFSLENYDYCTARGFLSKMVFEKNSHLTLKNDAIRHLHSALVLAKKLNLSEAALQIALHELGSAATDTVSTDDTSGVSGMSQKFWYVSVSPEGAKKISSQKSLLLKCPMTANRGDYIILSQDRSHSDDPFQTGSIVGMCRIKSPVVLDAHMGAVGEIQDKDFLDEPLMLNQALSEDFVRATFRQNNLSYVGSLKFWQIEMSAAERLLEVIKSHLDSRIQREDKYRHVS